MRPSPEKTLARFALLTILSVAICAAWYVAARAWFESGKGLLYSLFFPQSAWVFVWPLLAVVVAWWAVVPKPRVSVANLLLLPVALVGGLLVGMYLGLAFTCEHLNKCM